MYGEAIKSIWRNGFRVRGHVVCMTDCLDAWRVYEPGRGHVLNVLYRDHESGERWVVKADMPEAKVARVCEAIHGFRMWLNDDDAK